MNYTHSRVTNHPMFPFIGLTTADWAPTAPLTGTTPDGVAYNIPLFIPDAAKVAANGGGRLLTNFDDYATTFDGIEVSVNKRMSNRWMARIAAAWNNPQEHYDMDVPVNENGNPDAQRHVPADQRRPVGAAQRRQRLGRRVHQPAVELQRQRCLSAAGWDVEFAGNLFGKQGTPYPYFRNAALGREGNVRILLNPELDSIRFETLWNLDLRAGEERQVRRPRVVAVDRGPVQRDERQHRDHA